MIRPEIMMIMSAVLFGISVGITIGMHLPRA